MAVLFVPFTSFPKPPTMLLSCSAGTHVAFWFVGDLRKPQAVAAREGCPVIAVSEGSPTTPDRVSVFDAATGSLLRHIEGDMKCVSTAGGALR